MKRRDFLASSVWLGLAGLTAPSPRLFAANNENYTGELLITIQAQGAWDVSSYCDPKVNQIGEKPIANWSNAGGVQQAGNIPYAAFANNQAFFDKYHNDMLVINGVDAQTNSHTTGVLHNWSGRNAPGFPTLTALFAASKAPGLPISYINFGGFSATADLIRFSRIDDLSSLRQILDPLQTPFDSERRDRTLEDMNRIASYRTARLQRLKAHFSYDRDNLDAMADSLSTRSSLSGLIGFLPSENDVLQNENVNRQVVSSLGRQIQLTLSAFSSGLCSASDLIVPGFDTHQDHDSLHEPLIHHLNEKIDFLWTQATALGLADRLTVVLGSDFARTPFYNSDNGKDHWPIGSTIVMRKGAPWGNRVIGQTDEAQNAIKLSPITFEPDENGSFIYPQHVHQSLRTLLGLNDTAVNASLAFINLDNFDFFA